MFIIKRKPFSFHDIVVKFVEIVGESQWRQSQLCFGEFSDPGLARQFRELHNKLVKLLLVHQSVNQSLLRLRPNLGTCSHCQCVVENLFLFPQFVKSLCKSKLLSGAERIPYYSDFI